MNHKKKILFVIDSLGIGGGEKSLVTLLNLIDYSKYEVDLQLFAYGGKLQQFLPKKVNLLPPLNITEFLSKPILKQLYSPKKFLARLKYSLHIRRKGLTHADKAVLYWKYIGPHINPVPKHYDIGIAYAQGIPTFFVVDRVSAYKKFGWINAKYAIKGKIRDFQHFYYKNLDSIVPVSNEVLKLFSEEIYPDLKNKMKIMWDIIDPAMIINMSKIQAEKELDHSQPILMTTGRLSNAKGYDIAMETSRILKNRGVKFKWYVVGDGYLRDEMEKYIHENDLKDYFILLGSTTNPYSYMLQSDVYVQPSRNEGFGLTIAEARILNRPIVCTNFEGCEMQMKDGKNGIIASFEPEDIANKILMLLNDKELYSKIQEFQRSEKIGNTEEINNFYKLISE